MSLTTTIPNKRKMYAAYFIPHMLFFIIFNEIGRAIGWYDVPWYGRLIQAILCAVVAVSFTVEMRIKLNKLPEKLWTDYIRKWVEGSILRYFIAIAALGGIITLVVLLMQEQW